MFEDDEIKKYQAKFGCIEINDTYFDDHPLFSEDYVYYKIQKIKIWFKQKKDKNILAGIQTTYINVIDSTEIESEIHKGENIDEKNFIEINLKNNEYLIDCRLWASEDCLNKIILKSNLKNEYSVGDEDGEEKYIDELKGNKIILSFFGTFNANLFTSIGLFIGDFEEFFKIFIKGYILLKIMLKRENYLKEINEKINKKEYDNEKLALIKTCMLPKAVFAEILKFVYNSNSHN